MRIFLFISLFLFLLNSCRPKTPEGVLKPAQMQMVMWDMMRADDMAEYYAQKDSSYKTLAKHENYYSQVMQIHHISKDQFQKSLHYYQSNPAQFRVVLDSLQHMSDRLQRQAETMAGITPDTLLRKKAMMADTNKKKMRGLIQR